MNRLAPIWLVLLTCAPLFVTPSQAQQTSPEPPESLAALALAAQGDHQPVTAVELSAARARLRGRAEALQRALGVDSSLASGWKEFLAWELLQPHFADDHAFNRKALANLDQVVRKLRRNEPGLELPAFTSLARAIEEFRTVLSWAATANNRDAGAFYDLLLKNMSQLLQRHVESSTVETQWQLARLVQIVDEVGDSPELIQAIRRRLRQPNVFITASARVVNRAGARPVDQMNPVRDCILGTSISGCARVLGDVRFHLCPDPNRVALEATLVGQAGSRTVGYNGPVKVGATGTTAFSVSKRLWLSESQFSTAPSRAAANTSTRIHSIRKTGGRFGRRLVERIAWRRAADSKAQSEYIAARHAEQRVARNFDKEVNAAVANGRQRWDSQLMAPLIRRGVVPDYLRMHSDTQALGVDVTFGSPGQLAAKGPPPLQSGGPDLGFRLHESAVSNYMPLALGGVTISQQAADQPPEIRGPAPAWLKEAAEKGGASLASSAPVDSEAPARPFRPWSITLNQTAPVGVRFDDGKVAIRIRAARLESPDEKFSNWDFIVTYRLESADNQIVMRRTGQIEVFPGGFDPRWDKRMAPAKASFRSTLAKNMNARAERGEGFPAEVIIPPLTPPNLGTLLLSQLQSHDGWLSVSWQLP